MPFPVRPVGALPALLPTSAWQHGLVYAVLVLLSVLVATVLLARRLVTVTVRGPSMEPTFQDGDRVLVRRGRAMSVGQVVVVERPTPRDCRSGRPLTSSRTLAESGPRWMIKRVAAVPGDRVPRGRVAALANVSEDRVPPGLVVLLGDNHRASFDSRQFGYFPAERILGAVLVALPPHRPKSCRTKGSASETRR
ncbi:S26 family signal peptidase [Plantactinospora sp. B6F1]|uniref:S26 family signal peptidase n=1 Tax=Plantactinospora sp. B6F1 TaxID=3158971 RepID=UPI00102CA55C